MGWIILGSIIALILWIVIALEFANIAKMKGYTEKRWFWYSFLFTAAGWLMVVALPSKNAEVPTTKEIDELPEL